MLSTELLERRPVSCGLVSPQISTKHIDAHNVNINNLQTVKTEHELTDSLSKPPALSPRLGPRSCTFHCPRSIRGRIHPHASPDGRPLLPGSSSPGHRQ